MKKIIELEIDEDKYNEFEKIINNKNITINNMLIALIYKTLLEDSVDWLYTSLNGEVRTKNIKTKKAMELFREKGYSVSKNNTTFATKNDGHDCYWLNPDKRHLKEDWYIILNDNINKRLYLLFVPGNSIKELKMRNNITCNVSITYNDLNFVDINSGIYFKNFLKDFIDYDSLI